MSFSKYKLCKILKNIRKYIRYAQSIKINCKIWTFAKYKDDIKKGERNDKMKDNALKV